MNREEAENFADSMSYTQAVYNVMRGIGIPYRKATLTKLRRMLDLIEAGKDWVLTKDGLPKKTGRYLVTFKGHDNKLHVCELGYRKPENYWTSTDISVKAFDNNEILAWREKPEPYHPSETNMA